MRQKVDKVAMFHELTTFVNTQHSNSLVSDKTKIALPFANVFHRGTDFFNKSKPKAMKVSTLNSKPIN